MMESKSKLALLITIFSTTTYANTTIINNYSTQPQPPQPAPMQMQPQAVAPAPTSCGGNSSGGIPPGTYQTKNADGSINTIYTTGDKQPYIVDNSCNQPQPIIQPYVYPNVPFNTGGNGPNSNRPLR